MVKRKRTHQEIQELLNKKLASIGVRPGGRPKPGSGHYSAYLGQISNKTSDK